VRQCQVKKYIGMLGIDHKENAIDIGVAGKRRLKDDGPLDLGYLALKTKAWRKSLECVDRCRLIAVQSHRAHYPTTV